MTVAAAEHPRCGNCRATTELVDHPDWGWTCRECVRINSESAHVLEGQTSTTPVTARSPVHVPVPVPSIEKEREDLFVLLDAYEARELKPQRVETKELPQWATPSMRRVLEDLAFCAGLHFAKGDDGTVIYAVEPMAKRLELSGSTVSIALRRLKKCGAIRLVKVLPATEKGRAGTRVYAVEPGRRKLHAVKGAGPSRAA